MCAIRDYRGSISRKTSRANLSLSHIHFPSDFKNQPVTQPVTHTQTIRYDPTWMKNKNVLVTGSNRGIGLALTRELVGAGALVYATCRKPSKELESLKPKMIISDVDVTSEQKCKIMASKIPVGLDVVINNAGYFAKDPETIDKLVFDEEIKMIDICALGPLRVTSALFNAKKINSNGGRVAMITSQGGSITWRDVQNAGGDFDYGHHMSKAAANMMGKLLSLELKKHGISVYNLHPGFNRTDMTSKYSQIWDVEGAVDATLGAKRVMHEIFKMKLEETGKFVNCEDGLEIPW
ncbi:SDR family NAD(P)-dependent oxidoreductase [bacterium]|nr:SDR family NAD(P)-dependent oxidoreductase [bacterium]